MGRLDLYSSQQNHQQRRDHPDSTDVRPNMEVALEKDSFLPRLLSMFSEGNY